MRRKICIPIVGPTALKVKEQVDQAQKFSDFVECRFDLYHPSAVDEILHFFKEQNLCFLFTLRHFSHGGSFQGSEEERLIFFRKLLENQPDFIDVEGDAEELVRRLKPSLQPKTKLLLSYHNWEQTPTDLEGIVEKMQALKDDFIKLACWANRTEDALRMLQFLQGRKKLIGLCMGDKGVLTRTLAPVVGSAWTYACLKKEERTAPGQISAQELVEDHHHMRLNQQSKVYALIGAPVSQSVGHIFHNQRFLDQSRNAVYEKIHLEEEELGSFFQAFKRLPFYGLSVTMPLKQAVLPFLDVVDERAQKIAAVNTVWKGKKDELRGGNTDGLGALDALEKCMKVDGKKVIVLGAGGAARAIVDEATRRGASVSIVNRNFEKAKELGIAFDCPAYPLESLQGVLQSGYDMIIQCTNVGMTPHQEASLVNRVDLKAGSLVMDIISNPRQTKLLCEAQKQGCEWVSGQEMFIGQAVAQSEIWQEVVD